MSYDIQFRKRRPGQSWDEAFEEEEERVLAGEADVPLDEPTRVRVEAALGRIRELLPRSETRWSATRVELDDMETGIQLGVTQDSADLSVPYWHEGERAEAVGRLLHAIVSIVEEATGCTAYDRQQERPFLEDAAGATAARQISEIRAMLNREYGASSPKTSRRPWWRFW